MDTFSSFLHTFFENNLKGYCIYFSERFKKLFNLLFERLSHVSCFNSFFDWKLLLDVLKYNNNGYNEQNQVRKLFEQIFK